MMNLTRFASAFLFLLPVNYCMAQDSVMEILERIKQNELSDKSMQADFKVDFPNRGTNLFHGSWGHEYPKAYIKGMRAERHDDGERTYREETCTYDGERQYTFQPAISSGQIIERTDFLDNHPSPATLLGHNILGSDRLTLSRALDLGNELHIVDDESGDAGVVILEGIFPFKGTKGTGEVVGYATLRIQSGPPVEPVV